ncbi:MAG: hypothetical protein M3R06_11785 [Chloroflexota bacterium]|nr:hypothetical protein [Chloroflexota bacterium]
MRFATVHGLVVMEAVGNVEMLHLKVFLALGRGHQAELVRDESLAPVRPVNGIADLNWHADQWTQETLGIELALAGWEPIGVEDLSPTLGGQAGIGASSTYYVRGSSN